MNNFRRRSSTRTRTITRTQLYITAISNLGGGHIDIIDGGPKTLTELESNNLVVDVKYWFKCCLRTYYSDGSFEDGPEEEVSGTIRIDLFYIYGFSNDYIRSVIKPINTSYGDVYVNIESLDFIGDNGTVYINAYVNNYNILDFHASYQKVANSGYSVRLYL